MESGAIDQERILEASLVQNWWFIKSRGQDPWAERAAAWLIIYHGVRGGKEKGRLRKDFHMLKKTHRIPRPCHCQVKAVYPSSKALT